MVNLSQFGNVPSNLVGNANLTIEIVNEVFAAFPNRFRFTSGYRSPARNAAANGVSNSFHLTAQAADFVPVDGRFPSSEKEAIAALIGRYGYEVIQHDAGSGLHYHIEPAPGGRSNAVLLPTATGGPLPNEMLMFGALILIVLLISD